jgi:hypothetical protein
MIPLLLALFSLLSSVSAAPSYASFQLQLTPTNGSHIYAQRSTQLQASLFYTKFDSESREVTTFDILQANSSADEVKLVPSDNRLLHFLCAAADYSAIAHIHFEDFKQNYPHTAMSSAEDALNSHDFYVDFPTFGPWLCLCTFQFHYKGQSMPVTESILAKINVHPNPNFPKDQQISNFDENTVDFASSAAFIPVSFDSNATTKQTYSRAITRAQQTAAIGQKNSLTVSMSTNSSQALSQSSLVLSPRDCHLVYLTLFDANNRSVDSLVPYLTLPVHVSLMNYNSEEQYSLQHIHGQIYNPKANQQPRCGDHHHSVQHNNNKNQDMHDMHNMQGMQMVEDEDEQKEGMFGPTVVLAVQFPYKGHFALSSQFAYVNRSTNQSRLFTSFLDILVK